MTKTKKLCALAVPALAACIGCMTVLAAPAASSAEEAARYADVDIFAPYATETIYYTNRIPDHKYTDGTAPKFMAISGMENACGAVAGAEIVAFYDKYFPNLIPNYESFIASNGKYKPANATYIYPMMQELYELMDTNVQGEGVNEIEFKNGLTEYINGKGYNVSYTNIVSGSSFDYNSYKNAINNNKVVALLSQPTNLYLIGLGSGYDTISATVLDGNHIMLAYGYAQIKYYNSNGLFRTDTYLEVSTGLSMRVMYYKINPHNLDAAYTVNIS